MFDIQDFGCLPYEQAWRLQQQAMACVVQGSPPVLLLGEHPAIYTAGRATPKPIPSHINGIAVLPINRGGQLTYHGPGQLVVYPVFAVSPQVLSLKNYVRLLEKSIVQALALAGFSAETVPHQTGVWLRDAAGTLRKIASIGVGCRRLSDGRWLMFHGLALNIATDLDAFYGFSPCGLSPTVMGSVQAISPHITLAQLKPLLQETLIGALEKVFLTPCV